MEADKQEKTDNELIAEFMGLQFVRVGYIGDDDPEDGESQWQKDNQDWFDKHYEFHDNSVGNYAVNIKDDLIFWQDDLKYDTSWDCLMPVVEKIEAMERTLVNIYGDGTVIAVDDSEGMEMYGATTHGNKDNKISHVYRAVVEFIHWHNSQKPLPL